MVFFPMTPPHKHLGSQTSHVKRRPGETCCAHARMLSLEFMSRPMLMFMTDIPPKADVNFYSGGQPQWTEYQGGPDKPEVLLHRLPTKAQAACKYCIMLGSFIPELWILFSLLLFLRAHLPAKLQARCQTVFGKKKEKKKNPLSLITVRKQERQFLSSRSNPRRLAPPLLRLADTLLGAQCCFVR